MVCCKLSIMKIIHIHYNKKNKYKAKLDPV